MGTTQVDPLPLAPLAVCVCGGGFVWGKAGPPSSLALESSQQPGAPVVAGGEHSRVPLFLLPSAWDRQAGGGCCLVWLHPCPALPLDGPTPIKTTGVLPAA